MLAATRQWVNVNDAAGVKTGFKCFGKLHFMIVLVLEELVVDTMSAMGGGKHDAWHTWVLGSLISCSHV